MISLYCIVLHETKSIVHFAVHFGKMSLEVGGPIVVQKRNTVSILASHGEK